MTQMVSLIQNGIASIIQHLRPSIVKRHSMKRNPKRLVVLIILGEILRTLCNWKKVRMAEAGGGSCYIC